MASSAAEVRDYGGHSGGAGMSSQGAFSPGLAYNVSQCSENLFPATSASR